MYWTELNVWKSAHELVLKIYQTVAKFPSEEKYTLSDQLKRAAYSVPANIVEGHARKTPKEFVKFLYHSRGSLEEVRYFLLLSKELRYLNDDTYNALESQSLTINKMLNSLINSIKQKYTDS